MTNVIAFNQRTDDAALREEAEASARLVAAIRNGDSAAETEMIQRYSRGLRYLLRRRIGDDERARDLVQDTFCVAIQKLREIDLSQPERLAGYLRGIGIRVAQNAGRKKNREPLPVDNEIISAVIDQAPGQYDHIASNESADAVRILLKEMPRARDRDLLQRYYLYDQDKQEICAALGLSSLHFNRVLFRAKERFRKLIDASCRDSKT